MPEQRVVVTGIGLVTPLGPDRETTWRRLVDGARAVRWLDGRDPEIAALAGAPAAGPVDHPENPDPGPRDPVIALALAAAREAVADSALDLERLDRSRLGIVVGTSKGGLRSFSRVGDHPIPSSPHHPLLTPVVRPEDSPNAGELPFVIRPSSFRSSPWLDFLPHAPSTAIACAFGAGGPLLAPVAACATGLVCLNRGAELIQSGACDVVLAGSSDASLLPAVLGSFRRLGVLAHGFADAAAACRPFDRHRTGFVVGEGAAILVLERLSLRTPAQSDSRRSTLNAQPPPRPYAEWIAAAAATDPAGLTQLDPEAASLTRVVSDVLARSGLAPDEIDYVNLHGTATRQNDLCETRAIRAAFGPAADRLSCSSIKGAIGHLLGAAGSVEAAVTLLALRDQVVPPTVNLERADPACDLDYTPLRSARRPIRHALKLSLGFGGHLAAAVFARSPDRPPRRTL